MYNKTGIFTKAGLCATVSALGLLISAPALQAQDRIKNIELTAQPLANALIELSRQADTIIIAPGVLVEGLQAPAVYGEMPIHVALERLLADTNLHLQVRETGVFVVTNYQKIGLPTEEDYLKNLGAYEGDLKKMEEMQSFQFDEIVVTATKRSTSLQDTALSISVLTGGQLEKRGISSLGEVISSVPGVDMASAAPGATSIIIRGISTSVSGEDPNSTQNQTTSSYLDELPLSLGIADIRMVDLERVEVLKGPQGTLYGQSAMGGLVRYITNKPDTDAFSGNVGSYVSSVKNGGVSFGLQGHVNVPLSDTLAIRAVAYRYDNAGFIDAVGSDIKKDANTEDTIGGRISLRWQVTDRVTFDATYLRQEIELGAEQSITNTFTPTPYTFPVVVPATLVPLNTSDPKMQHVNPRTYQNEVFSVKVEAEFDAFTAMAIGSKKRADADSLLDTCSYINIPGQGESGEVARCPFTTDRDRDIETLELRFVSNEPIGGFVDWIVGGWYENKDDLNQVDTLAVFENGDSVNLFNAFTFVDGDIYENWDRTFDSNEAAIYSELGLNFTEDLKLTLGYRHSIVKTNRETITADGFFDTLIGRDGALGLDAHVKENVNTFKFNMEYKATDDVLLYALVSSGYRAGGFNVGALPLVPPSSYDSDTLWNYELGAKTSWFDGRLVFNATLYQIDWQDIQLSVRTPPSFVALIANAGSARIRGMEAESSYLVTDALKLGFNFAYKDAELTEDYVSRAAVVAAAGSQLPGSSKFTYSVYADWRSPLTSTMDMVVYATHRYIGGRQGDLGSMDRFEAYSLTDLNVGVSLENGVDVSVFANNIFNNVVSTNMIPIGAYHLKTSINRPRTIGLRAGYTF